MLDDGQHLIRSTGHWISLESTALESGAQKVAFNGNQGLFKNNSGYSEPTSIQTVDPPYLDIKKYIERWSGVGPCLYILLGSRQGSRIYTMGVLEPRIRGSTCWILRGLMNGSHPKGPSKYPRAEYFGPHQNRNSLQRDLK